LAGPDEIINTINIRILEYFGKNTMRISRVTSDHRRQAEEAGSEIFPRMAREIVWSCISFEQQWTRSL